MSTSTTRTRPGDLYALGAHRLACFDSLHPDNCRALINGAQIDLLLTDPPYAISMEGGHTGYLGNRQLAGGGDALRMMERVRPLSNFDPSQLSFLPDLHAQNYLIFSSDKGIPDYLRIFPSTYNFSLLVWAKTNPTPLTYLTWLPSVEYLLHFRAPGAPFTTDLHPNYLYFKHYVSAKEQGRKDRGDLHPTMKPLQLLRDKIQVLSRPGAIVLDLFGGSGSTLLACEQTGRTCYMAEINPVYCDVIIDSWESLTHHRAQLLGNYTYAQ